MNLLIPPPPSIGEWKEITPSPYQLVSSQAISGETSGTGACDWTILVNSHKDNFFIPISNKITCPANHHLEYRLEALVATSNNDRVVLSFGGIETDQGCTWYTINTWKRKIATSFFTLDEVTLDTVGPGSGSPGIQVKYKIVNGAGDWRIYYPTVQTYIVPDEPIYKYQRIS